jgi:hypothetical protein
VILANYAQVNRNCNRDFGAAFTNPLSVMRAWNYPNSTIPDTTSVELSRSGFPHGYNTEGSYSPPLKSGAIAAVNAARATLTTTGAGARGRNLEGSASPTITTTGTGQLVVSGVGAATATLTTTGSVVASLAAVGSASPALSTSATARAKGNMVGSATMSLSASATRYATGKLEGSVNLGAVAIGADTFSNYLLDEQDIETGLTLRQALRVVAAASAGKVSGAETATVTFRNAQADTKNRIVATVDGNGNRVGVTLDVS